MVTLHLQNVFLYNKIIVIFVSSFSYNHPHSMFYLYFASYQKLLDIYLESE